MKALLDLATYPRRCVTTYRQNPSAVIVNMLERERFLSRCVLLDLEVHPETERILQIGAIDPAGAINCASSFKSAIFMAGSRRS